MDFYRADLSRGIGVFRLIRTACRQRFEGREPCQGDDCAGRVVIAGGGGSVSGEDKNASLRTSLDRANNVASEQRRPSPC